MKFDLSDQSIYEWCGLMGLLSFIAIIVIAATLVACNDAPQQPATKTRIVTTVVQTEGQPKPLPVPAEKEKKEAPYYGATYWDELLTSVYYYPAEGNKNASSAEAWARTHLKFDHREDDIWLCGDQRKSFEPGNRYKLTVTFEPNQPCVTNWKVK